jgi:hypothetical protein
MMKVWHLAIIVVAILIAGITSTSVVAATVTLSIDGVNSPAIPLQEVPKPGGGSIFLIGEDGEGFTFENSNGRVELGGELDPDPVIGFGAFVQDFGVASDFSFSFVLPLSPLVSNPSFVKDSLSGSVTNAAGPGVTVTALSPPVGIPTDGDGITEMEVFTLSDDGGVTWKNVGLDLGPTVPVPLPVGDSGAYGSFNEGLISTISGGPWTHMRADINFRLSGGSDIFTFNGAKTLVPEPGTLVLSLLAISAVVSWGRRSAR